MDKKVRVGILGIGGVGGFIGAPLVQHFTNSDDVELIFICRGETQKAIKNNGLRYRSQQDEIIVKPDLCSSSASEIGILDVLIITTKSYSLKAVLSEYSDVIGDNTVLITLQNMVNSKEVIREVIPEKGTILEGCIYVAAKVVEPGTIQHVGGPGKIFIGGESEHKYTWLVDLLTTGGLDITYEVNIKEILWKKFLFVAPVAGITSAFKITFGQILENEDFMNLLENMMLEIRALAAESNIDLSAEDIQNSKELLTKFPYESKSSLQLDFENNNQTEKHFLVDYVIENSSKKGFSTPSYNRVNEKIEAL